VTKADYEVLVKSDEHPDKLEKVFRLTRANCPVGLLFEKAGVDINYQLKTLTRQ
jgi:hypothetical protein